MPELMGRDLLLGLNRPQYVSVPEALITALATNLSRVDPPKEPGRVPALVYWKRPVVKSQRSRLYFTETIPREEALDDFAAALESEGIHSEVPGRELARAIAEGLRGVQSPKGGVQAATPLTPALALMQDMVGLQSAAHPPAVGKILERMFMLGCPPDQRQDHESAAARWKQAAERRCAVDPLAKALDAAVVQSLLPSAPSPVVPTDAYEIATSACFSDTPFAWFHHAWMKLTSPDWVDALPARVWVDWASTVLRLAMGCGYLWEGAWYETLARSIVLGEIEKKSWNELVAGVPDVIPWKSREADVSVRDIASPISWRVRRGDAVRALIQDWFSAVPERGGMPLAACLSALDSADELRESLEVQLASKARTGPANNLWEAIKYALKTREVSGPNADYYGLLTSSGRYLLVEPGAEWIAAVASLSCPRPGTSTNVGRLQADLARLGMRPELPELIWHLERAGVARGSADADAGVQIQSAFEEALR